MRVGLETGAIGVTYPEMDTISVGQTLQYVRMPDEQLETAAAAKVHDLPTETLKRIPAR